MANNRIQIKRTSVPGRVPNTTNSSNSSYIAAGEFALNMYDKQLYTSDGTNLITVGSTTGSLTVSDSIRIGDISSELMSINATSIFTGNVNTNTSINTTSISVQNATSNSSLSPTTVYVGNNQANISIDVTGGVKTIAISTANISPTGIATIQTSVNHGITSLTQSKVFVDTPYNSLNTANYSSDYNPAGFNITAIPTANTISFTVPTDNYKYKWGDRSIQSISRVANGTVTVVTKGLHNYQSNDKAYVTNVNYRKAPFTVLASGGVPTASTLSVLDPVTVTYLQSSFASNPINLTGGIMSIYNSPTFDPGRQVYSSFMEIRAQKAAFVGYSIGNYITFDGFPTLPASSAFYQKWVNPAIYNNLPQRITNITYPNDNETIIEFYFSGRIYITDYGYSFYPGSAQISIPNAKILLDYVESSTPTNLSQLCPALPNTSIGGTIYATNPVGITIKNNDKLVYVFDSGVYVGNTTIGNIVDSTGSRTFKPTG